jgi:hypothetical protein
MKFAIDARNRLGASQPAGTTAGGTEGGTTAGGTTPAAVVSPMMDYGKWIENNDKPVERLVDSQRGFGDSRGILKKSTVIPDGYSYVTDGYTYLSL